MKVHEILRSIRRQRNLTLENLAAELGISYSTYQGYEQEGSKIQIETLEEIAKFYKLSLLELLSYQEQETGTVLEPYVPYSKKNGKALKVIIELDGTETILQFWLKKLENINAAL